MLATPEGLHTFEESPLPLDPTIRVVGIHAGVWLRSLEVALCLPRDILTVTKFSVSSPCLQLTCSVLTISI